MLRLQSSTLERWRSYATKDSALAGKGVAPTTTRAGSVLHAKEINGQIRPAGLPAVKRRDLTRAMIARFRLASPRYSGSRRRGHLASSASGCRDDSRCGTRRRARHGRTRAHRRAGVAVISSGSPCEFDAGESSKGFATNCQLGEVGFLHLKTITQT